MSFTITISPQTPNILSDKEFRTFWIMWNTWFGTISVGIGGQTVPFMSHTSQKWNKINYVAFASWENSGKWEILPHHLQFETWNYNYNNIYSISTIYQEVIHPDKGIISLCLFIYFPAEVVQMFSVSYLVS